MLLDTDHIPFSCRKTLPLNVLLDVMESEGFITPDATLNSVPVRQEKELAGYVTRAHDFNRLAMFKRFQKAFCLALQARGSIAQIGIVGYLADQVVIDTLVLYT